MKNVKLFDTFIKVNEAMNKPNTMAKDVFRDATDALTKTMGGRKLDKKYVKDYLKSIEQMARKNPGQLVKDYGDFDINDWIEDAEYNLQNESKVNESKLNKAVKLSYKDAGIKNDKDLKKVMDILNHHKIIFGERPSNKEFIFRHASNLQWAKDVLGLKEGKLNEKVSEKEVFAYLRDLRDSGKTNMFGAGEYLEKAFNLDKRTARELLTKWMKSF